MFDGIDPKVLGAVRALAAELRYRELTDVIGRHVLVESIESIDPAVRGAVPAIPPASELLSGNMAGTLAKYGLLDLHYGVDRIDAPPGGWRTLRALGLLERDPNECPEELADTHSFVFELLEECRSDTARTIIFLQGPRPSDVVPDWWRRGGWRGELVEEYLPRELTIIDACETNCASVWLSKHLYL